MVVIDLDIEKVEYLRSTFPKVPILHGDGIDGDLLQEAAIEKAKGVVVATGNDKDNMVITISARQINPQLRIVTRCNEIKNLEILKNTGADSVVSSNFIGGLRMASEMVRPTVVSFLDVMLRDKKKNLRVEEVHLPEGSNLDGKKVGDAGLRHVAKALIMAVKTPGGEWFYNPDDDFVLKSGMDLIIMGSPNDKLKLEEYVTT